jgi:hypothetical protein
LAPGLAESRSRIFGFNLSSSAQILINNKPAPVLFASPTQMNLQASFEYPIAPGSLLQVVLHAAALNQDGTVNSANNPAPAGSMWPAGMQDGALAASAIRLSQEMNRFQVFDQNNTPLNIRYTGTARD